VNSEPAGEGPARRFSLDPSVQRFTTDSGAVLIGGSPLKLFRLTHAGRELVERLAAGGSVPESKLTDRLLDAGAIHPDTTSASAFGPGDVTIVVPTFGPPGFDPGTAAGTTAGVIVVDDGSEPPVTAATIRLGHNQGPAAARNAGLASVITPLVAFVDADVDLPRGWLEPLLWHFDDPRVAVVAPRVATADRPGTISRYERQHGPLDMGSLPARVRAGTRVSYVPAAVVVCRVDALRAVGGFDTDLRFGEDVDIVWRLDATGWRCRYDPGVVVHHGSRPHWRAWIAQRVGYGSSAAPLARRHEGRLTPLRTSGWSLACWSLAAVGAPVAAVAVGVGSAVALVPKLSDVPPLVSFRLAAVGNLRAGDAIASAVRRAWLPIVMLAAIRSKIARRVLIGSLLAARHPLVALDDAAYCWGVWQGMIRERTLDPLVPEVTSWPGKQPPGGDRP
jgi:mycofactocin system glycosyltransferase